MAQFSSDTRRWLEGAIRQRKLLIRMNKSYKPGSETLKALEDLERLLKAYSYQTDLHMARFVCQNIKNIELILPGSGAASYRKRQLEWNDIRYHAVSIIMAQSTELRAQDKEPLSLRAFPLQGEEVQDRSNVSSKTKVYGQLF